MADSATTVNVHFHDEPVPVEVVGDYQMATWVDQRKVGGTTTPTLSRRLFAAKRMLRQNEFVTNFGKGSGQMSQMHEFPVLCILVGSIHW